MLFVLGVHRLGQPRIVVAGDAHQKHQPHLVVGVVEELEHSARVAPGATDRVALLEVAQRAVHKDRHEQLVAIVAANVFVVDEKPKVAYVEQSAVVIARRRRRPPLVISDGFDGTWQGIALLLICR